MNVSNSFHSLIQGQAKHIFLPIYLSCLPTFYKNIFFLLNLIFDKNEIEIEEFC